MSVCPACGYCDSCHRQGQPPPYQQPYPYHLYQYPYGGGLGSTIGLGSLHDSGITNAAIAGLSQTQTQQPLANLDEPIASLQ